ncbi:hypothetical protein P152DRAFT_272752 [Eremomyces bilateralis CBS 781.70]|uniref:Uncharacterized protein n=1 Tax=Eremomyces bilateralis CBS 781.70 TaxID=1392243 RepID=A0A6G1G8R6_9PEZI|nr:uncharacterized protein P152DRAFT_272752 [Eremomyces bilateralis CBS 781.70]KAF1814468.1 hypothetical protein P152DRAFT_272752 [Eremomyces bilateralis CBS 781.70]
MIPIPLQELRRCGAVCCEFHDWGSDADRIHEILQRKAANNWAQLTETALGHCRMDMLNKEGILNSTRFAWSPHGSPGCISGCFQNNAAWRYASDGDTWIPPPPFHGFHHSEKPRLHSYIVVLIDTWVAHLPQVWDRSNQLKASDGGARGHD